MLGLIEADLAAARQRDLGDRSPAWVLHLCARHGHAFGFQRRHFGFEIVAHQIKLVAGAILGGMDRGFGRRQREDQPAMPCIHRFEIENVAEERPVGLRILAEDYDMRSKNHVCPLWCDPSGVILAGYPPPRQRAQNLAQIAALCTIWYISP